MAQPTDGSLEYIRELSQAPWLFDERYLGHITVGMNDRIAIIQNMPDWIQMGAVSQSAHTFVAMVKHVITDFPTGETFGLYWGPVVPNKVPQTYKFVKLDIDAAWTPPPATETMTSIGEIVQIEQRLFTACPK